MCRVSKRQHARSRYIFWLSAEKSKKKPRLEKKIPCFFSYFKTYSRGPAIHLSKGGRLSVCVLYSGAVKFLFFENVSRKRWMVGGGGGARNMNGRDGCGWLPSCCVISVGIIRLEIGNEQIFVFLFFSGGKKEKDDDDAGAAVMVDELPGRRSMMLEGETCARVVVVAVFVVCELEIDQQPWQFQPEIST